ncbi:MAG: AAA family ATPase [Cyanothece sp. SIO1E1]|nr:AAA family ATPase [Cyanothece sp. SIO1E1]
MAPPFVKRYLLALDRYKWAGLASFMVVFGVAGVAALQPPPPQVFKSEGTLIQNAPPVTLSATTAEIRQGVDEASLLIDTVVETVSQRLAANQRVITPVEIRRNASVDIEGDTGAQEVVVSYEANAPEESELVVSLLMEAMVELSRLTNTARLRALIDALNERLPGVEAELRETEQQLEQYDRQEGPAIQAALDGSVLGEITGRQQQQRELEIALAGIEAQIRSLQARLGLDPGKAYASSALSADPIIANLRAQISSTETQLSLNAKNLKAGHPTMIELRKQQQAFEELLRQRAAEVIGGGQLDVVPLANGAQLRQDSSLDPARQQLANNLVDLDTQKETLKQQLVTLQQAEQDLRQQYASIPNKQLERARLEQQVVLKRALYDQIQARRIDAEAAEAETVGSLTIAQSPSTFEVEGTSRNGLVTLAVGAFVGVLVGGGVIFLLDSLDSTFRTLEDLRDALRQQDVPLLGMIPLIENGNGDGSGPILLAADSVYLDSYERFRSNLRLAASSQVPKMVLVTSTADQEGKTVSAYNLAIASAHAGKRTLLIEADLRSPSQAQYVNVTPDPHSVTEPLRYYGQLGDCIRLVPAVENLYVVPSSGPQRQAAAILESTEMRRFLEDVRGRFDMVILDTPALSRCNDAILLEPYTDGMLLATRPGYTDESLLTEAIDQLTESDDLNFLGAIINGADIDIQAVLSNGEAASLNSVVEELEIEEDFEQIAAGNSGI